MSGGKYLSIVISLVALFGLFNSETGLSASYSISPPKLINGFFNGEIDLGLGEKSSLAGEFSVSAWDPLLNQRLKHRIITLGLKVRSNSKGFDKGGIIGGLGITYFKGDVWNTNNNGDTTGYIFDMNGLYTSLAIGTQWYLSRIFISPSLEITQPLGGGNIGGKRRDSGDMEYKRAVLAISFDIRIGIKPNRKFTKEANEE